MELHTICRKVHERVTRHDTTLMEFGNVFLFKADVGVGGGGGQGVPKNAKNILFSMDNVLLLTVFEFRVVLGGCFRTVHEVVQIQLFEQHSCPLHFLRLSVSLTFSHCG